MTDQGNANSRWITSQKRDELTTQHIFEDVDGLYPRNELEAFCKLEYLQSRHNLTQGEGKSLQYMLYKQHVVRRSTTASVSKVDDRLMMNEEEALVLSDKLLPFLRDTDFDAEKAIENMIRAAMEMMMAQMMRDDGQDDMNHEGNFVHGGLDCSSSSGTNATCTESTIFADMMESVSNVIPRSRENSCEANDNTDWVRNPGAPPSPRNSEKEELSQKRGHATLMERSIDIIVLSDNPRAPKTVQGFVLTLRKRNSNNALAGFRKFVWKLGWLMLDSEQLSLYKTKDLSTTHMCINLIEPNRQRWYRFQWIVGMLVSVCPPRISTSCSGSSMRRKHRSGESVYISMSTDSKHRRSVLNMRRCWAPKVQGQA